MSPPATGANEPEAEAAPPAAGPASAAAPAKPQRVLACVLCQQRKVKCDRVFPCVNCLRAGAECVPAHALARRQRRRRFPERDLLERLRHYESLLSQHNIPFEPLHPSSTVPDHAPADDGHSMSDRAAESPAGGSGDGASSREKTPMKSKDAVDLWQVISRVTLDADDDGDDGDDHHASASPRLLSRYGDEMIKVTSSPAFQMDANTRMQSHMLFAPLGINPDLSASHPEQVQIFRLWQIYLDNVNPLLKVTHTPSLQPLIIDAASNIADIDPALEALMFSIYCTSIASIEDGECRTLFQWPKKDLLAGYQSACQNALLKCGVWRSNDVKALTALYLYLVSATARTDMRYLSCMHAMAIRIAQRVGIHNESGYKNCSILEAEMRRRLWWSMVSFDYRLCELTDFNATMLLPTWDCQTPLNVNDFELRVDMKHTPAVNEKPGEAIFAVVRSELADFVRHSPFHLNIVNPALNSIAQPRDGGRGPIPGGGELDALSKIIEDKYFALCDMEDHIHYTTVWATRSSLARSRLFQHYLQRAKSPEKDAPQREGISCALDLLECDTKLRMSPLTKRFLWYLDFYLPAMAYLYILNDLRKHPSADYADVAWVAISENYNAYTAQWRQRDAERVNVYVEKFAKFVCQAWGAREASLREQHRRPEPAPRIVVDGRNKIGYTEPVFTSVPDSTGDDTNSGDMGPHVGTDSQTRNPSGTVMSVVPDVTRQGDEYAGLGAGYFPDLSSQGIMDLDMDQFWTDIDWKWMQT